MTTDQVLERLTLLGQGKLEPRRVFETFPNKHPHRDYIIQFETDEFTALCPKTGQPDFAAIHVEYIPDKLIVESKSIKMYIWSFRNVGIFHEHVTNVILDDLVGALNPRWCKVVTTFAVRGGIDFVITAEYRRDQHV
jgi:7-cyano-7-deazaguanine reductase